VKIKYVLSAIFIAFKCEVDRLTFEDIVGFLYFLAISPIKYANMRVKSSHKIPFYPFNH